MANTLCLCFCLCLRCALSCRNLRVNFQSCLAASCNCTEKRFSFEFYSTPRCGGECLAQSRGCGLDSGLVRKYTCNSCVARNCQGVALNCGLRPTNNQLRSDSGSGSGESCHFAAAATTQSSPISGMCATSQFDMHLSIRSTQLQSIFAKRF